MTPTPPKTKSWEDEFDEMFVNNGDWWQTDYDYPETATPPKVKDFIRSVRTQAIEEERERIRKWVYKHAKGPKTGTRHVWYDDLLTHLNKK